MQTSFRPARSKRGIFSARKGNMRRIGYRKKFAEDFLKFFKKAALTLTFLCVKIYNCTSIGKLRDYGLFAGTFLKKEQKKYNPKSAPNGRYVLQEKRGDCFLWCMRFNWGSTASA